MVRDIRREGKTLYLCEACGLAYAEKEWAQKCQEWCEAHNNTCNIEIMEHAVPLENSAGKTSPP